MKYTVSFKAITIFIVGHLLFFNSGSRSFAEQPELATKQVLLLHSYHEGLPWEKAIDESFQTVLESISTSPIEINIEHTDRVRYTDETYRQKLVELYRYKYSNPKMDLIIGTDDEAVDLLLAFGDDLFPGIPIVLVTTNRKEIGKSLLPPNIHSLLWEVDIRSNVELIKKLLPQTQQIFIIAGTSPSDQEALNLAKETLREHAKEIELHYLTDISGPDLVDRVTHLPKQSVILYLVFSADNEGASFIPKEVASILAEQANVPTFGILETYLGGGVVGGYLLSAEMHGRRCAEITHTILNGAPFGGIDTTQSFNKLMFDWRQLRRWGINEEQLPSGSIVQYKPYSIWERYKDYLIVTFLLVVIQSGFITFLLRERRQRYKAQVQLSGQLHFQEMLATLSARLANLFSDKVHWEMDQVLKDMSKVLDVDQINLFAISVKESKLSLMHSYSKPGIAAPPAEIQFEQNSWVVQKLTDGKILTVPPLKEIPTEAETARNLIHSTNGNSIALLPLSTANKMLGVLSLNMREYVESWSTDYIHQCRLIAETLSNELVRRHHEKSLLQAEQKYRTVADFNYDWEYWVNIDGSIEYISPSCLRITGYSSQDFFENPSLIRNIIAPDYRDIFDRHCQNLGQMQGSRGLQFQIEKRDGSLRWVEHVCQKVLNPSGEPAGIRVSNRDITARKQTELELRKAYANIKQLKDQLEAEANYLQEEIKLDHNFNNIIGNSPELKYVLYKVEQVAPGNTTTLILGESGTGKELIARAIHSRSPRADRPLIKVNCATLPATLIESELFGHERGAFTGAHSRHLGRFEIANGSSIFLDEIGELPPELQTKLLRVLEVGEIERLGNAATIHVNVRVIAATNRNLEEEILKGRFRQDLFYRLNVYPITIPPLRQRIDDIPLLTQFFVARAAKRLNKEIKQIPNSVIDKLMNYSWPGNIRELINVIERSVINSTGPKLCLQDDLTAENDNIAGTVIRSLHDAEREHILKALQFTDWRIEGNKGAAAILQINPSTLRSRMKKLKISKL